MKRALFLDRDGVINIDHGYIWKREEFEILPGVVEALRIAHALDYALIVVTNQSGIARGYFSEAEYWQLEEHMRGVFAHQGVKFTAIYHCPHHVEGCVERFVTVCDCRKPRPGMILRAAAEHGIDLAQSIMVGDKQSDIDAATAAGVGRSFLIESHKADSDLSHYKSLEEIIKLNKL